MEVITGSIVFNNPETWELGLGDWYADKGTWEVGSPSSGPGDAYAGENCAATVLDANYHGSVNSRLISPQFTVPGADQNPRLRFWHWYSISSGDKATVQIKTENGQWENILDPYINTGGGIWSLTFIDLSSYANSKVQIAFHFTSDGSGYTVSSGWYIDDIIIEDNSNLTIDAGSDININLGSSASLNATASGGTQPYIFEWAPSEGLDDPAILNPLASPSDTTRYTLTVTDANGCFRTDKVSVFVDVTSLNDETDVLSFGLSTPPQTGNADIDLVSHTIDIEVDYGTDLTELIPTFTLSNGATAKVGGVLQQSGTTANDFTNAVVYVITAEDGTTTQAWTVSVSVAPNDETDILSYIFSEQTGVAVIDLVSHTIDIEVEYGTDLTDLVATFTLSDGGTATVGGLAQHSGTTANDFTSQVTYIVTAEDGTTVQDWIVTVAVAPNTETDILSYSFSEQTGVANIDLVSYTVNIEVEYGTDITDLVATFTLSDGATAAVGGLAQQSGTTVIDFTSAVAYVVTAEDGTTVQDWIVTVTVAPNDETDIQSYSFSEQTKDAIINAVSHTVEIEVKYGTDVTALVATFTLSEGATAAVGGLTQQSGTTSNDFTSAITYLVTAEDGTTVQDWIVTVTVAPNTETNILSYSFGIPPQTGNAVIDPVSYTVNIEVEYGTDVTALVATFTLSDGATATVGGLAQQSGTTANDFASPVTYTITAEDGTTVQDWIVTITVAPNTETDILSYSFSEQTEDAVIDAVYHTIIIEVEYGTDITDLVATFTLSDGATAAIGGLAQQSGTTANDFTSTVTYNVTAEDGTTTQDWAVTVNVAPSNETEVLSYGFGIPPQTGEAVIDAVSHTITIEVEHGTDITALVATFTLSEGATAPVSGVTQQSGVTTNNFTNSVTYVITAKNGITTQDWTVIVSIATGINENSIRDFKIYPNTFSDKATIEFSNPDHSNYKLSVYSISGNKVFEMDNITSDRIDLKKGDLSKGVYIIELRGENVFISKLIIE